MGFDGRYGNKICINCFVLNHLCSMWSSADWFPPFKQAFKKEVAWKEHCTYLWVVLLSSLVMPQNRWTPPHPHKLCTWADGIAWTQVRDLHQEETINKSCRHSPMAGIRMTCTASLQAPQSVSTLPPRGADTRDCCSCPNISLYPTCLASLQPSEGRQAYTWCSNSMWYTFQNIHRIENEYCHLISSGIFWNTSIKTLLNEGGICFMKKMQMSSPWKCIFIVLKPSQHVDPYCYCYITTLKD